MVNSLEYEIIKILLLEGDYLSAEKIAKRLHVSRRTIFNNIEEVRNICINNQASLESVKSKGFKIINSNQLSLFMHNEQYTYCSASNEEYKLYIIYLLLSEESPLHVSELESIMYLSRPTIYRLLEEIGNWFKSFSIELKVERKGVFIEYGQKRYRRALANWMYEVKQLLNSKRVDDRDYFKLGKAVKEYCCYDLCILDQLVSEICEILNIHCSTFELSNMAILLDILLYQNQIGNNVDLSDRLCTLTINFFSKEKLDEVIECIYKRLQVKVPFKEIIYFTTSVLLNGNLVDKSVLDQHFGSIQLNSEMMNKIRLYIDSEFTISDNSKEELIKEINDIIKLEVILQIRGDVTATSNHYDLILKNFYSSVFFARNIYLIVADYYQISYAEKMICNVAFSILTAFQKNKRYLRAGFLHDCDVFEYKYMILSLQRFPYISLVYSTDVENQLNDYLTNNHLDIIFSTIPYENKTQNVHYISRAFGGKDTIDTMRVINEIYEEVNFKTIVKNYNKFLSIEMENK